jgi:hypothetical protein
MKKFGMGWGITRGRGEAPSPCFKDKLKIKFS